MKSNHSTISTEFDGIQNPLRLIWRDLIKNTVREIVVDKITDPVSLIEKKVSDSVPQADQDNLKALIIDELRRLHEGVLSRYGLKPSEFTEWKSLWATNPIPE